MITKAQLVDISTRLKEQNYALPILSSSTHTWWDDARLATIKMMNFPMYVPMPIDDIIAWAIVILGYQANPAATETIAYAMEKIILCGMKIPGNLEAHLFHNRAVNPDFVTTDAKEIALAQIVADSAVGLDVADRGTIWLRGPPTNNVGPFIDYIRQLVVTQSEPVAASFVAYYFLAHLRLVVKDPMSCLNLPEKIVKNFSSLYKKVINRTIPVGFDQHGLRCLADHFSQKTPQTLGFLRVVLDRWVTTLNVPNERNNRGLLESAIVNSLALNGLPVLSMAQRALMAIDASLPEIWEATKGLSTDKGHYYAAATWICYLIPDEAKRAQLLANYVVAGAPPINQHYWRFSRLYDDTTMMGLSGVGNDDSIYLYAKIHDLVYVDNQIIPNYRILHTKYLQRELDDIAEEVRNMFSSLLGVAGEVGEAVKRARTKGTGRVDVAQAAPAPAPRVAAVAPIAAPAPAVAVVPVVAAAPVAAVAPGAAAVGALVPAPIPVENMEEDEPV